MPLITNSVVVDSVLVLLCLIVLGYLWFLRRYTYWARRGVYSPKPTIPWGNIKDLVLGRTHIGQQFEQIYYETRKHPFVGIYMIHKYALVINDPELIKSVVVKDFMHFTDHGLVHHEESEPLEGHLFNINGNRWRNVRLRLIPNFTSGKMKVMFDTVVKFGKVMQEYIEPNINMGKPVDVKETLARFSTDIVGTCVFGVETNSLLNEKAIFRNMSKKSQMLPPLRSLIQTMSLMAPKIVENLKMSMYQNDVNEFFKESAREALKHRQQNNTKNDYMQTLLKLREEREEKQRNNELLGMNIPFELFITHIVALYRDSYIITKVYLEFDNL